MDIAVNERPLVIYHGNCTDGFTAAWVFHHYYGKDECDFVPGAYGGTPPDVTGRKVFLVDFSYKREVVAEMLTKAAEITLIDHHKTAIDDLQGLPGLNMYVDQERSGAGLAWDFLCGPTEKRPDMLEHVQDRDLWKFKLPLTKMMSGYIQSTSCTFEEWDRMMTADIIELARFASQGSAVLRKTAKDVEELVRHSWETKILGYQGIPVANVPGMFASDVGHALCQGKLFSLTYSEGGEATYFSLRSDPEGLDVSDLAKIMGGGGHKHASGFKIARGDGAAWSKFYSLSDL